MNDCLTHEQVLALVSARRVADVELWSHVTQCGECHRRIAEMTGVAWLAASLEAFLAGAVDGVPHEAVHRIFDRLRPLYEKEVARLQNCPDDEALLAFTLGDTAAAEETRRHVQQCGSCQKAVVQLRSLHEFVTDYEAFLSAPNETIPDPVARRIFENVNAVCQTEHSARAEHPDWAWLLSMLAGTTEPKAEVRAHVAGCTECREFLSRLLGTVRFAGALEVFTDDRESEMPLAAADRIFERVHAAYQQNVAAASRTRTQVPAGTDAEQPLPLDENLAGPAPSEAGQAAGQSGLWRRLLPYASAASLLLALGVHGFKGSLSRVGDLAPATQAIIGSDAAATAGRQHHGLPPNGTATGTQSDRIVRSTPHRGSAVLPTVDELKGAIGDVPALLWPLKRAAEITAMRRCVEGTEESIRPLAPPERSALPTDKDKTAIDMAIRLRAAANIACVGPDGNTKVQKIADYLREVDTLGPVPAPFQPLYNKLSEFVDLARHGELTDLGQTAEQNEAAMREWLRSLFAGITKTVLTQRAGADSDLRRTLAIDQEPQIHEYFRRRLESLIHVIAALANPAKWSNLLNAHPAGSYDVDRSRPQDGQSSSNDRHVRQTDLTCVTEAVVRLSISVG